MAYDCYISDNTNKNSSFEYSISKKQNYISFEYAGL